MNGIRRLFASNKMNHFGESVDYYENRVMTTLCTKQSQDKFHAYISTWLRWNRKRKIETCV